MKNLFVIVLVLLSFCAICQEFEKIELDEVVFELPCPSEHNVYSRNNPNGENQSFNYINHDQSIYILVAIENLSLYKKYFDLYKVINSESDLKEFYASNLKKGAEANRVTYRKYNWSYPTIDGILAMRNEGKMMYYMDRGVYYHDNIRFILNGKLYWFHFQCNADEIEKWEEFRNTFFNSIKVNYGLTFIDQFYTK